MNVNGFNFCLKVTKLQQLLMQKSTQYTKRIGWVRTPQKYFSRFRDKEFQAKDEPNTGHPVTFNSEFLYELVKIKFVVKIVHSYFWRTYTRFPNLKNCHCLRKRVFSNCIEISDEKYVRNYGRSRKILLLIW